MPKMSQSCVDMSRTMKMWRRATPVQSCAGCIAVPNTVAGLQQHRGSLVQGMRETTKTFSSKSMESLLVVEADHDIIISMSFAVCTQCERTDTDLSISFALFKSQLLWSRSSISEDVISKHGFEYRGIKLIFYNND